ncbi:MAG: ABATE domain-containing protein [Sporichthyaceae bacterium]
MFPLVGQYVSVDLANSCFFRSGQVHDALVAEPQEWMDAVAVLRLADGGTLAEAASGRLKVDEALCAGLIALRADVRALFFACARGQAPTAAAVKRLVAFSAAAPTRVHAVPAEGGVIVERRRIGTPAACLTAALAEDALTLAANPTDAAALFECTSPECIGVLLRNHPRQDYCSPRCATRDRVARHAARTRDAEQTG